MTWLPCLLLPVLIGFSPADLALLPKAGKLGSDLVSLQGLLGKLKRVRAGDGGRVRALGAHLRAMQRRYERAVGRPSPPLARLGRLLDVFPGLVVPLELREERGSFTLRSTITGMLRELVSIAGGCHGSTFSLYVEW